MLLENRENTIYAKNILQLGRTGVIELCASYLSYANINFIKRHDNKTLRYEMIRRLRQGITVLQCDAPQLDTACLICAPSRR